MGEQSPWTWGTGPCREMSVIVEEQYRQTPSFFSEVEPCLETMIVEERYR